MLILTMGCRPGRHSQSKFRIFPRKFYKSKKTFSDISLLNKGFQKEEMEFNKFSTTSKIYNHGHHHEMITLRLSTDGSMLQIEKNDADSSSNCTSKNDIIDESFEQETESLDSYSSKCKSEPLLSHKKKTRHRKHVWSDYDITQHSCAGQSSDDECEWFTAEVYDDSEDSSTATATIHHDGGQRKHSSMPEEKFNDVTLTPNLSKLSAEYITHLSEQILATASNQFALQNNGLSKYKKLTPPGSPKKIRKLANQRLQIPTTRKFFARFSASGDISFLSSDDLSNEYQNTVKL